MADDRFFSVLTAVKAVRSMPDGSPMPLGLKHTLLVLATYWPDIWPGQERLAVDLSVSRRNVNKRLRKLEDAGLIFRLRRGRNQSTVYRLKLGAIRKGAGVPVSLPTPERLSNGTDTDGAELDIDF